jgi:hypothetical protein
VLPGDAVVAVPVGAAGGTVRLSLAAVHGASVDLREIAADGRLVRETHTVVPFGTSVLLGVDPAAVALALHADGGVNAALVCELPDPRGALVGVVPVQPPAAAARVAPRVAQDPALGARR